MTKNGKQRDRNRSQSLPRGQQAGSEQQPEAEDRKIVRTASFPPSDNYGVIDQPAEVCNTLPVERTNPYFFST